jgi:hypothetical protein
MNIISMGGKVVDNMASAIENMVKIGKEAFNISNGQVIKFIIRNNRISQNVDSNSSREQIVQFINGNMNLFHNTRITYDSTIHGPLCLNLEFITDSGSSLTLMANRFGEFPSCCGKILCDRIFMKTNVNEFNSEQELKIKFLNSYFHVCKEILSKSPYTSMSLISSPENGLFNILVDKIKGFRLTNEFNNQRMSGKNLCREFEFNLNY